MGQFKNYYDYVGNEADSLFSDFKDEMIEYVEDGNDRIYEFFDDHVHYWVDSDMGGCDLIDHAEILEQSEEVESDWGLWDGMKDPRKAIEAQAFFTYRNDLMRAVLDLAKGFLEELEENTADLIQRIEEELDGYRDRLHDLQEDFNNDTGGANIEQDIDEVESDIMLAEERLDEAQDKLTNIQDAVNGCC